MEKRPSSLPSKTFGFNLGCGNTYVTVSYLDNKPFEVFVHKGHSSSCVRCIAGTIGKLCSVAMRSGVAIDVLTEHLGEIECGEGYWRDSVYISSCFDAVAKSLGGELTDGKD